ncbi:Ubiquitin carboxyl-terminal hydrolase 14 [Homalodisca vitripennis]|nr:Ubiquitin carboxyl-terminal hydrolase 14 [Homalodisca vitripennis]
MFQEQEDKELEKATNLKNVGPVGDSKKKEGKKEPYWFEDDLGSNNSGFYTLQAVLTHKGRSSSSGHYVAWVRQKGDTWLKCDDDQVSPVTTEEILKLSGGGKTQ